MSIGNTLLLPNDLTLSKPFMTRCKALRSSQTMAALFGIDFYSGAVALGSPKEDILAGAGMRLLLIHHGGE